MFHHELLQTQNVQISRWLLYLQSKIKQVRDVCINYDDMCRDTLVCSSRFTDSDKYSASFEGCFKISEAELRHGDICNACVLIVKRWKKLPVNSTKDWSHVVDARCEQVKLKYVALPLQNISPAKADTYFKHIILTDITYNIRTLWSASGRTTIK